LCISYHEPVAVQGKNLTMEEKKKKNSYQEKDQ